MKVLGISCGRRMSNTEILVKEALHQWESTDDGVKGRSSAVDAAKKSTPQEDLVWADHAIEEIGSWGVFLPQLYSLYRVITNTKYNPFADLSVERQNGTVRYKYINSSPGDPAGAYGIPSTVSRCWRGCDQGKAELRAAGGRTLDRLLCGGEGPGRIRADLRP